MTPDQQRETALHLYRLVWRSPYRAPEPNDVQDSDECDFDGHTLYYVQTGADIIFVEVSVHDANYARVVVHDGAHRKLNIEGPCGYVEDVLCAIPCSMRLHMVNSK